MSMNGCFRSVAPEVIEALQREPGLAEAIAVRPTRASSARILAAESRLATAGIGPDLLDPPLGIDKAWGAIHFVLSGTVSEPTPPPGNAVLGGIEVGEDVGYGPMRWLSPPAVEAVADTLSSISDADFLRKFDAKALHASGVYPEVWDRDDERPDWVVEAFSAVRSYYDRARAQQRCMLLFIL